MPSRDEHLSKAQKNKEFAKSIKLDNPTSVGWALTSLFYSALHYIEAYNAKYNFHCKKHQDLNDNIARNPMLSAISDDYLDLSAFSWNARYQAVKYGTAEFEEALQYHAAIERHVMDLIANGH
ncbi:MAG: hypothetical protein ACLQVN_09800 [Bryobacteraceae bacterium]